MNYILTNNGAVLMTQVAAGRTILFTRTESGSGYAANPAVLQNVIDKKQDMFLEEVIFENRQAVVKTVLSNMQLEEGYQLRQVGVYAKLEGDETDTLVVIGQQYNGEKIPPYGEGIIQIEYDIAMKVSGTGNVTIEGVGTGYVTKGQFLAHLSDYNNPHKVTAKQVGLDKVPNVGTDDQTPKFEEAEERENITSEEKLSVIFGKIRKWLSDLKAAAFCSVANNLVTTLPGSVLDARQGKELEDQISGLYSEITPVVRTKDDGILTYLVSGLEYTNCTFVKYGPIIHAHLHGTCPYQLGVNIYAKITDPAFIPSVEITAVAAFASGTAKNGTGILKIKQDGSINIIATEEGLNWIFADVFYVVG